MLAGIQVIDRICAPSLTGCSARSARPTTPSKTPNLGEGSVLCEVVVDQLGHRWHSTDPPAAPQLLERLFERRARTLLTREPISLHPLPDHRSGSGVPTEVRPVRRSTLA